MTHVEIPAVDYARAKNAAKAVKTRLHDLGNDVCLNHAYEAVAASLGFKTWAVMKAQLEKETPVTISTGSISPEIVGQPRGALGFGDLTFEEFNPVIMVHGPAGLKRDKTVSAIARLNLNPKRPMRVIGLGAPDLELAAYITSTLEYRMVQGFGKAGNPGDVMFYLRPHEHRSAVNPFDLPLDVIAPSLSKRARMVSFLQGLEGETNRRASGMFLHRAVDLLYKTFLSEQPFAYHRGVDEEIDAHLSDVDLADGVTWIEVARILKKKLQLRLARKAWRFGSPRLEHLMSILRHDEISERGDNRGRYEEGLADRYMRLVSSVVREYPFLQRPTAVDFDGSHSAQVIGIEMHQNENAGAAALLFRVVVEVCVLDEEDVPASVAISSGAELIPNELVNLMEKAHADSGLRVVVACERELQALERYATTHVVVGCVSRAQVQEICGRLNIGGAGFELIHERLFGEFDEQRIETYCVRRKFVNQREGLVTIPLRGS